LIIGWFGLMFLGGVGVWLGDLVWQIMVGWYFLKFLIVMVVFMGSMMMVARLILALMVQPGSLRARLSLIYFSFFGGVGPF